MGIGMGITTGIGKGTATGIDKGMAVVSVVV